ncbi:MAG: hypothetical protein WCD18_07055 [Thermosynechococcaceae cyanobacterium]
MTRLAVASASISAGSLGEETFIAVCSRIPFEVVAILELATIFGGVMDFATELAFTVVIALRCTRPEAAAGFDTVAARLTILVCTDSKANGS